MESRDDLTEMKERNESHSSIIVENKEETMMNRKRNKGFQTERKRCK